MNQKVHKLFFRLVKISCLYLSKEEANGTTVDGIDNARA